jgi:hypothetical protein
MRQILVIANETVESDVLRNVLEARAAADDRLGRCVERLRADGVAVTGFVGDADPMQAIADAPAGRPRGGRLDAAARVRNREAA